MAAKTLYGDFINYLCFGIVIVTYVPEITLMMERGDPKIHGALTVAAFHLTILFLGVMAWLKNSQQLSNLSFLACLWNFSYMNLRQWHYEKEYRITGQFQCGIVLGVLANLYLPFENKIARLTLLFLTGSFVSINSNNSTYVEDALPILGDTVLIAGIFLTISKIGIQSELLIVHSANLVLLAAFLEKIAELFIAKDFDNLVVIKTAALACICVATTGSFGEKINRKQQLEVLVKERTKDIQEQADKLEIVNLALQASETAIAITNSLHCIVWMNGAFEKLCCEKKGRKFLLCNSLVDVLFPENSGHRDIERQKLIRAFSTCSSKDDVINIDGSTFNVEITSFPNQETKESHHASKTKENHFLVVLKDITIDQDRKAAERTAQQEAAIAKAMSDSMVTLTHELRTPLQGIMGVASLLLQEDGISKERRESINLIMGSSSLLLSLINNLLGIRKIMTNMMSEVKMTSISALSSIEDAVAFCMPLASISNVKIAIDYGAFKYCRVKSNALQLQQILINLISNGIKYTSQGSDIRIIIERDTLSGVKSKVDAAISSTNDFSSDKSENILHHLLNEEKDDDVLVFHVSDSGPGIAPYQAGRLFHRFLQLDENSRSSLGINEIEQPAGTVLGLHLCKLYVQRMNGHIWATNNASRGSTFSFSLPLVSHSNIYSQVKRRNTLCRNSINQLQVIEDDKVKSPKKRYKVLLVDDILINRKVMGRVLSKTKRVLSCKTVDSGYNALRELRQDQYDLVITDLQMPGMSGTKLSENILRSAGDGKMPIVVGLTADTSTNIASRCAKSGMSDVLYKPVTAADVNDYFEKIVDLLEPCIWFPDCCLQRNGKII